MEIRSQVLQVRVTPKERLAVEKHCKDRGETVSEYGRSAILTAMVFDGSGEALMVLADATKRVLRHRMEEWMNAVVRTA